MISQGIENKNQISEQSNYEEHRFPMSSMHIMERYIKVYVYV